MVLLLALVVEGIASCAAAAPYESIGFLEFPTEVELNAVSAVAIDADDNIYVLHRGTPPIVMFDAERKYVRGWGSGMFKVPHGLRFDAAGHLWTTDNGNHVLRKFNREGRLLETLGAEGKPGRGQAGFNAPDDVVFDTEGNFYIADTGNGRIVKLDREGNFVLEWGSKGRKSGEFATAHGLAIDAADRIYVADRGNNRVQVFDATGKHLADWTGFGNPFGLLKIGDELIVSEGDQHKLIVLDREGKIAATWGDPSTIKLPHLMAVNSQGQLFVAEVDGKRVQIFARK
jgi:DNA-binding beta-propeller fold protein YncE